MKSKRTVRVLLRCKPRVLSCHKCSMPVRKCHDDDALKRNSSIILLPFYFKTCRQPITHDHARAASRTAQRDPVYSRMSLNVQPGTFIFHANWWGSGRPHDEAPKLTVQLLLLSACRPCTGTMGQKVHLHFKSQRTRKYSLISCFLPCLCTSFSIMDPIMPSKAIGTRKRGRVVDTPLGHAAPRANPVLESAQAATVSEPELPPHSAAPAPAAPPGPEVGSPDLPQPPHICGRPSPGGRLD